MRVLQFNNRYTGTGAERVMRNLGRRIAESGNEVFFATYEDCGVDGPYRIKNPATNAISWAKVFDLTRNRARIDQDSIDDPNDSIVKRAGLNLRGFIPLLDPITRKSVNHLLDEINPDIVHCHNTLPSLAPIVESKRRGMPVVVTLHGYWPICPLANRFQIRNNRICNETDWSRCKDHCSARYSNVERPMKKLQQILIENVDFIICVSNYMSERLLEYGYPEESVRVIHNGINEKIFRPTGCPTGDNIFHAGRLSRHKGSHVLFNVASRLLRTAPEIKLNMVGTGMGGNPVRISDNIEYLGWVTDARLIELYSESLCTVIPSIWPEPHPLTTLEAMACGTPVIGSRISGIEESIEDEKTGFLVDIAAPDTMASEIVNRIEELHHDPELREEMGRSARTHVMEYFNEERMLNEYLDIYNRLL